MTPISDPILMAYPELPSPTWDINIREVTEAITQQAKRLVHL